MHLTTGSSGLLFLNKQKQKKPSIWLHQLIASMKFSWCNAGNIRTNHEAFLLAWVTNHISQGPKCLKGEGFRERITEKGREILAHYWQSTQLYTFERAGGGWNLKPEKEPPWKSSWSISRTHRGLSRVWIPKKENRNVT